MTKRLKVKKIWSLFIIILVVKITKVLWGYSYNVSYLLQELKDGMGSSVSKEPTLPQRYECSQNETFLIRRGDSFP